MAHGHHARINFKCAGKNITNHKILCQVLVQKTQVFLNSNKIFIWGAIVLYWKNL